LIFQFLILFFFASNSLFSQTVVVEISGIRNTVGLIRLAFFANETDFRSDKPAFERTLDKTLVLNGNLVVRLDHIPSGTYGIALLDDENKNGKLDYRLVIPKEGFGFSNYEHRGIKRPALSDFSFLLKKNETLRVPIRIKYY
ncbi:MAG: DUF2141 domain-containing protein, partial [Bacteroidia bacterium]|nr:DUF2141 domain-containing protein [Bacteroidia bacterium]